MNSEDLKKRTRELAHCCVKLTRAIQQDSISQHFKLQLVRCATSMAANYQAACISQSHLSFIAKLSISIEEADEIKFWLTFMAEEQIIKYEAIVEILSEAKAISNILCKSRITARENLRKANQKNEDKTK